MNKKVCIICIILICIIAIIIAIYLKRNRNLNEITNNFIETENIGDERNNMKINLEINNNKLTATLIDNSSTRALIEKLRTGPITIDMQDYSNFEKVGNLGFTLPTNDENITTKAGDIILYQGNQLTIYYDSNSWNFTKLGRIDNVSQEELKIILGEGNITITISLYNTQNDVGLAPVIKLNNGIEMPVMGIGTYSLTGDTCINSIYTAIQNGYRKIDTAYMYGNEEDVGKAVRKAIEDGLIKREDIFVTTKLYPNQFSNPEEAIEQALNKLDIEYIDLMLLHHPGTDDIKAYKAMEKYVEQGKIKSLGLSNYYIKEIDEFLPQVNIKPVLVQNEIHPYYQERDVVKYLQSLDIVVEGWYPLGGRGHQTELLNDSVLKNIAENHNKSVAQVILRWDYQNNVIIVPGSSNPEHIKENISIFDFELSDEEMKQIESLNRNEKHDWY